MILWIKLPTRFYSFSWYFPAILFCFQICSSDLPWLLCGKTTWIDLMTLLYVTLSPQFAQSHLCNCQRATTVQKPAHAANFTLFVFGTDNKSRELQKQIPADEEDNAMEEMPIQPSLSSESKWSSHAPGCKGSPPQFLYCLGGWKHKAHTGEE